MQKALSEYSDEELQNIASGKDITPKKRTVLDMSDEELEAIASPKKRTLEAALQGFGQGVSFGYLPNIQAAAEPITDKIFGLLTGKKIEPSSYLEARDANIKRDQQLQKEAPGTYAASSLAGSLSVPIPGLSAIRGASTLGKVGRAAGAGAITGLVTNPGEEKGAVDPLQINRRLSNAALGGALGAGAQSLASGVKGLKGVYDKRGQTLDKISDFSALDSIGARKKDFKRMYNKDSISDVAKFIRDEGIAKAGGTFDDAMEKAIEIQKVSGQQISNLYKTAQDLVNDPRVLNSLDDKTAQKLLDTELNTKNIYDDIVSQISNEFKAVSKGPQAVAQVKAALSPMKNIGEITDISELLKFRRSLDETINFDKTIKDMPQAQKALTKARAMLVKKIDLRIDAIGEAAGKNILGPLKDANKRFSLASQVFDVAKDKVSSENANRMHGLTDVAIGTATGGIGAVSALFDPNADISDVLARGALGFAAAKGSKAIRKYGPAMTAQGTNKLSSALKSLPNLNLPKKVKPAIEKLVRSGLLTPERLGLLVGK